MKHLTERQQAAVTMLTLLAFTETQYLSTLTAEQRNAYGITEHEWRSLRTREEQVARLYAYLAAEWFTTNLWCLSTDCFMDILRASTRKPVPEVA